ncbi:MAG: hypothetical protein HYZ28_25880 [Myxococcales bacterium]|nr:hypothetical protein [Myxococcales bacterium]
MRNHRDVFFALLAGIGVAACGGSKDKCAKVQCPAGQACEPASGTCKGTDGGSGGGGAGGGSGGGGGADCTPACSGATPICDSTTKTCKTCTASQGCSGTAPICDVAANGGAGACVQCRTEADCSCPTPICNATTKNCEAESTGFDAGVSADGGILGETCSEAVPLPLPLCAPKLTFEVDTSRAANDAEGSCASSTGPEVVYRLQLAAARDVTITSQAAADAGSDPVIYVRSAPCDSDGGTELACRDRYSEPEVIRLRNLAPGEYYLFVEGYGSFGAGPTEVSIEVGPPTPPPPNDTCTTAQPLILGTNGTVDFVADTSGARDDHQGSCNSFQPDSPELVYRLTLTATKDVLVTASEVGDAGVVDPVIYLTTACGDAGVELGCEDMPMGDPDVLKARRLQAGDYYLFVEGYSDDRTGPTAVNVTVTDPPPPPSNDLCSGAQALTIGSGGTVSFTVDTGPAADDYQGSCNFSSDSPEVVYSVALPGTKSITVTTSADGGSVDPVVYLTESPCGTGTELACDDALRGTPDSISVSGLDAGVYFIYIEGYGSAGAGPTDVTVTVGP